MILMFVTIYCVSGLTLCRIMIINKYYFIKIIASLPTLDRRRSWVAIEGHYRKRGGREESVWGPVNVVIQHFGDDLTLEIDQELIEND